MKAREVVFERALAGGAYVLYADIGFGLLDMGHSNSTNVGISETTMIGMAAGMASEGAKVYTYCIAPHYLRAWEFIRNLLAETDRDVTMVAGGVGEDYKMLGHPHMMFEDEFRGHCNVLKLPYYCPKTVGEFEEAMAAPAPKMLHLRKDPLR